MVMDLDHVNDVLHLNLRQRLKLGASVEPGKWRLSDDESAIDNIDESHICGAHRRGLSILETSDAETAA